MLTEKDYCGQNIEDLLAEVGFPIRDYQFCLQGPGVLIKEKVSLYEAQKWLREDKRIEIVVHSFGYVGEPYFADIHMYREVRCACSYADTYEEALSEGIKEAVKRLKEEEQL